MPQPTHEEWDALADAIHAAMRAGDEYTFAQNRRIHAPYDMPLDEQERLRQVARSAGDRHTEAQQTLWTLFHTMAGGHPLTRISGQPEVDGKTPVANGHP